MPSKLKTKVKSSEQSGQSPTAAAYLSLERLINIEASSEGELADYVERRLPTRSLSRLLKNGLQESSLYDLVIPRRTLEHRVEKKELLTTDESDKAVRIARVIGLAEYVFKSKVMAWAWLEDLGQFNGKSPLLKAATAAGARQVEERLYQIYYGIFG